MNAEDRAWQIEQLERSKLFSSDPAELAETDGLISKLREEAEMKPMPPRTTYCPVCAKQPSEMRRFLRCPRCDDPIQTAIREYDTVIGLIEGEVETVIEGWFDQLVASAPPKATAPAPRIRMTLEQYERAVLRTRR